jgi:hypothetical protein
MLPNLRGSAAGGMFSDNNMDLTAVSAAFAGLAVFILFWQVRGDTLFKIDERWHSEWMLGCRVKAAKALIAMRAAEWKNVDELSCVHLDAVLDYLETIARLVKTFRISGTDCWHWFFNYMEHYFRAAEPYIKAISDDEGDTIWADLEGVVLKMEGIEKRRSKTPAIPLSDEDIATFLRDESSLLS